MCTEQTGSIHLRTYRTLQAVLYTCIPFTEVRCTSVQWGYGRHWASPAVLASISSQHQTDLITKVKNANRSWKKVKQYKQSLSHPEVIDQALKSSSNDLYFRRSIVNLWRTQPAHARLTWPIPHSVLHIYTSSFTKPHNFTSSKVPVPPHSNGWHPQNPKFISDF